MGVKKSQQGLQKGQDPLQLVRISLQNTKTLLHFTRQEIDKIWWEIIKMSYPNIVTPSHQKG